ncbi:alpha/beta fold hydrolase [Bifidobacterium sp. 82T10]|uniref:Alpha/beta fold hydrolase n=1 Tax=Bifidobacterium miconis TaxID=2834435 RepID=A0ABS6WCE3_9BIFI|nr:alpha/beta hydrolase [Bifidobacterium miconis]MBW3091637.1 alpha/beta fold hydrolase [Bifidobacterium miconis]
MTLQTFQLKNNVYRDGDGASAPLVLVHAFPVDHRMWDDCAAEIIRQADAAGLPRFAVWAPDMPGAGDSPIPGLDAAAGAPAGDDEASSVALAAGGAAADGAYEHALDLLADAYVALLREAGYEKAVWAGLSMGGYVILDIQRRHPDAVAGFAMCDTKGDADAPAQRANRVRVAEACDSGHTVDPVMHFADATDADSSFKRSDTGKALFARWIRDQRPEGIAWRQRMAAGRPDLNDQLPLVTAPAAVIGGDRDPFSPPSVMRAVADAMTGTDVTYTEIADCGHFSATEHPATVAAALVDLMRRVG